jgi:hypothetical protein
MKGEDAQSTGLLRLSAPVPGRRAGRDGSPTNVTVLQMIDLVQLTSLAEIV